MAWLRTLRGPAKVVHEGEEAMPVRAILVLLLFLLPHTAPAQSQPPSPTPPKAVQQPKANSGNRSDSTANKQRPSPNGAPVLQPPAAAANKPQSVHQARDHENYTSAEWWLVYITGTLTAVTLGLAIYTSKLWGATRDTAKRELRAYVFVDSAVIRDVNTVTGVGLTLTLENYGQTPAYKCTFSLSTRLVDNPHPHEPATAVGGSQPAGTIAPRGVGTIKETCRAFTEDELVALRKGAKTFYVWGDIHYVDAFKVKRTTYFRYRFGGETGTNDGNLAKASYGNDTDDRD